jgi:mono/diheme cytochrome c family protein
MSSQFTTTTKDETARFAAAIGGRFARLGCACALVVLAGCQQQMADQPSYKPLDASSFFTNGQSARQLVAGTVARGHLEIDTHFYTGRKPGANRQAETATPLPLGKNVGGPTAALDESQFVDTFPFPVTLKVLSHGRDRFLIYCAVCHDPRGTGRGKIVERGYTPPPSYHIPRLRSVPVGHLFAVVSEGYGSMPSYAGQISPRDRWAIVAYVKALQLSQHFPADKLSPEMKKEMQNTPTGKEVR